jgi:hypothetical protein
VWVTGLEPDTEYRYRVLIDGWPWGEEELHDWSVEHATLVAAGRRYDNRFRTFPDTAAAVPVTFAVLGDFGADDSESSDDRDQLADNLFLDHRFRPEVETGSASLGPGLFYRFQVGANLEFICIDTSIARGMDVEHYFDDPAHADWVAGALAGPGARWRIPFSHHPPFCAGPEHTNTAGMVERLVPLFEQGGVRLVLSGHEHNFQHARVNGIHYVVSGAAGKLRAEPPRHFEQAGTRAWAAAGHFLLAHADADRVVVHALAGVGADGSLEPIEDPVARSPCRQPGRSRRRGGRRRPHARGSPRGSRPRRCRRCPPRRSPRTRRSCGSSARRSRACRPRRSSAWPRSRGRRRWPSRCGGR